MKSRIEWPFGASFGQNTFCTASVFTFIGSLLSSTAAGSHTHYRYLPLTPQSRADSFQREDSHTSP